jgi:hypothetical protein
MDFLWIIYLLKLVRLPCNYPNQHFDCMQRKKKDKMQQDKHKKISKHITKCSNHNSNTFRPARCHQTHTRFFIVQSYQTCLGCFQQL